MTQTPAPRPDAVIFDCDGVLVDSEPAALRLLTRDLKDRGMSLTPEEIETHFIGGTMGDTKARIEAQGLSLPDDWVRNIYDRLYDELANGVELIEGVEAVLDRLDAAGIPYAVGSNGEARKMEITLGQYPALRARFGDMVFSGQAMGKTKPDPALYLHAADALGVPAARCAVIDDSAKGCTAGVRAGARTLGYAGTGDGAKLREIGAEVFHRMADLPGLLSLP